MSSRYEMVRRDENDRLRTALANTEICRAQAVLARAAASKRAVNSENNLAFVIRQVRACLQISPGSARDEAERQLLITLEECEHPDHEQLLTIPKHLRRGDD